MTVFPASPVSGTTYWFGETLYSYDSNGWSKTYDLTPTHHWKLNDITGNVVSDSGSSPIAGSVTSCVMSQTGVISRCTQFTGTASYIDIAGAGTSIHNSKFSVFAWQKLSVNSQTSGILELYAGAYPTQGSINIFNNSDGKIYCRLHNAAVAVSALLDSVSWKNLGFTYNNSLLSCYIDGVLITSTAYTVALSCTGEAVKLGSYYDGNYVLNGYLEDVRIYDRALTQQEISAIYNRGKGTYSHNYIKGWPTRKQPIHHWKLQEATGNLVSDSGSSPIVGSSTSCVLAQTGKTGYAYQFTGTASYINCGSTAPSGSCSFSFWAKVSADASMTIYDCNSLSCAFTINHTDSAGKVRIFTGASNYQTYNNTPMSATWYHVVNYWNGNTMTLYINASQVTTVLSTTGTLQNPTSGSLFIGSNSGTANFFNGYLEDFRIYDYALSAQEIKNLYNNGKGTLQ